MFTGFLKSILGPAALVLIGIVGGAFGTMKLQKPASVPEHKCPDCVCPEPTVNVQPFDVDKIKGLRSFNYAPEFTGSIQVAGVDSAALRKMIDKSVDQAFRKYTGQLQVESGKKRGRKTSWIKRIAEEAAQKTDKQLAADLDGLKQTGIE